MKHCIEEVLAEAIMSKTPTIIVEGIDDIKFYQNICLVIGKDINVQAIETIEGYSEGCEKVKKAIEDIQNEITINSKIKGYILGIIDRDARYYKGEIPEIECLFVLNYYSYESHLIGSHSLRRLISVMTKTTERNINDSVINFVLNKINKEYEKLYYISLEALRSSCDMSYEGLVTYGKKAGSILDRKPLEELWPQIELKKYELDIYAQINGITVNDLKYISNGKWLLHLWCNFILDRINDLSQHCGKDLPKCDLCNSGKNDKCLWKVDVKFNNLQVKKLLCSQDYFDLNELKYIIDRINLLDAC